MADENAVHFEKEEVGNCCVCRGVNVTIYTDKRGDKICANIGDCYERWRSLTTAERREE